MTPGIDPAALSRRERILALTGVLLALLLSALDQTIVATAGPAMQRDLHIAASHYAWITTSYLVASTVMIPIYGKLSDRLGRKPVLLAGVVLFLLGSGLCGLAPSAGTLIAFRAIQGLGAASLFTSAFAVIADLFPPAVRGRYMGLVGGVMGLASVAGPLAGGFITDHFGWHWVFFINLPIGAVALWFIVTRMPRIGGVPAAQRPAIDFAGAFALVAAVVPLLVALSLGGGGEGVEGGYGWSSWQVLALLALSAIAWLAFVRAERRAEDPILHFEIFSERAIAWGTAAMFVLGAGFLFAVVFLPLYLVNVLGVSATKAGLTMMPLTLGVVAGSVSSGQLVARIGRYKRLMLGSLVLLMIGYAVMGFTLAPDSTSLGVTVRMVLVGIALGPSFPLYTLVVQNAARPQDIGVATAASTFSRSLGQVMGVAVIGTIFAAVLGSTLARELGAATAGQPPVARAAIEAGMRSTGRPGAEEGSATTVFDTARARASIAASNATADEREASLAAVERARGAVAEAFTAATRTIYQVGIVVILIAYLITLRIPEIPLRRTHEGPPLEL